MCPSSKEDFNEFEKLLKEKISQFEKSVHYSSFLESLFRELCISCKRSIFLSPRSLGFVTNNSFLSVTVEVDDLKKVSNSLSVLLSEKQKQEKVSGLIFFFFTTYILTSSRWRYLPEICYRYFFSECLKVTYFTAKQRKEKEESGLTWRFESTDER